MLAGQAIYADDTPVEMPAPGAGKTATARLRAYGRDERPWGGSVPPASWHRFSPDRKGQHPKDHLAKYQGWMHADGKDKSVFGKATRGSLSGEADGRAMIAKASIPPRTDDHADERCRIAMSAEATAGLLKRPQRQTSRWRSSGACHG
jgi:hypothetical protein